MRGSSICLTVRWARVVVMIYLPSIMAGLSISSQTMKNLPFFKISGQFSGLILIQVARRLFDKLSCESKTS